MKSQSYKHKQKNIVFKWINVQKQYRKTFNLFDAAK